MTATAAATGLAVETEFAELWTLANGKVVAVRAYYWDTNELVRVTTRP
jgi:ketosteroid isomerase-like protein